MERLDKRFPKAARKIVEAADRIHVYELKDCGASPYPVLAPLKKNNFQGCTLARQREVREPELKKELVEWIFYASGSAVSGNACFSPRHGIRAEHDGDRVELLICFECDNFRGVSSVGDFGGAFYAMGVAEFFEKILSSKSRKK